MKVLWAITFVVILLTPINVFSRLSETDRQKLYAKFKVTKSEKNFEESLYTPHLISEKHRIGPYLMYDCIERVFICVDDESFNKCARDRIDQLYGNSFNKILSCAPLKKFDNVFDCHDDVDTNMFSMANKVFCLNPRYLKN